MSAYLPQINSPERVREEFETAAAKFQDAAAEVFDAEQMAATVAGLTDAELVDRYLAQLPLVERFIIAELDIDAPSKRGIGRLADGDPPPRMGAKYRKQLRDDDLRQRVGLGAERLVLVGYAGQSAFAESPFAEVPPEDVWLEWLRNIIAASNDTASATADLQSGEQSQRTFEAMLYMLLSDHGGAELIEGFEREGIMRDRPGRGWSNARALSYWWLLVGAGRALQHVLSERHDPDANAYQPLHLLENYAEKRNKRQVKAQI